MTVEQLQALCNDNAFSTDLGIRFTKSGDGLVLRATLPSKWAGRGPVEPVHGGLLAAVLDTAATFALIYATGSDWSTVDLRVDFLRPVTGGRLVVKSDVLHTGRTLGRVYSQVVESRGVASVVALGAFRRGSEIR